MKKSDLTKILKIVSAIVAALLGALGAQSFTG